MRRLSIKGKITLWYTLFMIALTIIVLVFLGFLGDWQIMESVRNRLENALNENMEEIEYDERDGIEIDDDLQLFQDGVYLILYDEQGNPIQGRLPYGLEVSQTPAFNNGEIQKTEIQSVRWVFLDLYKPLNKDKGVWMRGIISQSEAEYGLNIIFRLFLFLLPAFVILFAVGGYYIICRAFAPIEKMRKTAEEITGGDDLSRRIRLEDGKDEIHQLADTFDRMMDRIQDVYEREKQFTSDVSHELRTPSSVIVTQAEYALRYDNPSGELKERLQVILSQSQKMSGMISQLLMLARADQGRIKLQKEKINLSELLEIIAEEEQERAIKRQIQVHTDCQPEICMMGDETMLMRCFINLIENAIVYGKDGGNIWIGLTKEENGISGYVRDDGIGISKENLPRIWERFYQVDTSRSSSAEGNSGLGLPMVKWIVEAHGGEITVESCLDKGTIFSFHF
ncbi:MAG: ATP-binding protein [Oliverpabstia sp.]|nr:ATP-binding protein [Oliverpabstia sp.]